MKRALLASFIAMFSMAICLVLYLFFALPRQRPPADIIVAQTPEQVERGRYLAEKVVLCNDCHSKRDWSFYGGPAISPMVSGSECLTNEVKIVGVRVSDDNVPGVLCVRNLTPEKRSGLGRWSDGEIIRAMREGVDRKNHGLFPIMPYSVYRSISDEDAAALVAYMRQLEPIRTNRIGRGIEFPMGLLTQFWPRPLEWDVPMPPREKSARYGGYLSAIGRCEYCHTKRRQYGRDLAPESRYAGGVLFEVDGKQVYSTNLTPHESGLNNMSREEFIAMFKSYSEPQPAPPEGNTPMDWSAYAGMTEADLGSIYDFLGTRRPVDTSSN
jgi:hypothetical protein